MSSVKVATDTKSKRCIRCKASKELSEFYLHSRMKDGHLNKCKDCTKADVRAHRIANIDYFTEYDRQRYELERMRRIGSAAVYRIKNTELVGSSSRSLGARNSNKRRAHSKVARSITANKPDRCQECGKHCRTSAHHSDYSKPLDVRWLCTECHGLEHRKPRSYTFRPRATWGKLATKS